MAQKVKANTCVDFLPPNQYPVLAHPSTIANMRPGLLLLAAALLASCGPSRHDNSEITRKKFASVYADLLLSNIKMKKMGVDTTGAIRDADSVLARHGVTREEYETMVRGYDQDPAKWKAFLEEVSLALGQELDRATPPPPRP
jgi:hypothetical protein